MFAVFIFNQVLNSRVRNPFAFLLSEYAGNIGDGKDPEAQAAEQKRILDILEKF